MTCQLSYSLLRKVVINYGWNDLLFLQDLCPTLDLYSVSTAWLENRKYVLKAKGIEGDLIILWL